MALRAALAMAVTALGAASCRNPRPVPPPVSAAAVAQSAWDRDLALARAAAARLEFAAADSLLRDIGVRFPATPQASEALFWRALFRLDPIALADDRTRTGLGEAATALDAYLAGGPAQPHFAEAATLRRLAALFDSLRTRYATAARDAAAVGTARDSVRDALRDSLRARDDELTRLRQTLQETSAELERLRRRLAPRRRP